MLLVDTSWQTMSNSIVGLQSMKVNIKGLKPIIKMLSILTSSLPVSQL